MSNKTQTNFLLINPSRGTLKAGVFVAEEELEEKSELGKLFALVEIKSREKKTKNKVQKLIYELKEQYYSTPTKDVESALENTCRYLNENILNIVSENQRWLLKLNLLLAVLKENDLFLSNFGHFRAWLIREKKMTDIFATRPEKEERQKTPIKLFSCLVTGEAKKDDVIILTSPSLFDYFSLDKIKEVTSTLSPLQAIEYFKNIISGHTKETSFATIIIKSLFEKVPIEIHEMTREEKAPTIFLPGTDSIKELVNLEKRTKKILTPPFSPNFKKFFLKFFSPFKKLTILVLIPKRRGFKLKRGLQRIFQPAVGLFKTKPRAKAEKEIPSQQLKIQHPKKIDRFFIWFRSLSPSSRILFIITLVMIILFLQSLVLLNYRKAKEKEIKEYNLKVGQITDQINKSQAALIYKDEEKARKLLGEAKDLLNFLPQNSKERREKYLALSGKLENERKKIYHIQEIKEPDLLIDFSSLIITQKPDAKRSLISATKYIYAFNLDDNTICEIDPKIRSVTIISRNAQNIGHLQKGTLWGEDKIIFLSDLPGLVEFNLKTRSLGKLDFKLPKDSTIQDLKIYAKKLYLLDTNSNQIYKYLPSSTGFYEGKLWVTQKNVDLKDASSFAIDGNIWLAKSSGEILKLFMGKRQNFEIKSLDKPFSGPLQIYTHLDFQFIYILDATNKRVVILDKDGKLHLQYVSDKFEGVTDFVVNFTEDKIYLLVENKIYEIKINTTLE